MKKNPLLITLYAIFLILLFSSCGNGTDNKETDELKQSEQHETQQEENVYIFPELDCGGEDFTFLNIDKGTWDFYTTIVNEEQTGEVLDDAIYLRNRIIEDKFNVYLKEITFDINDIESKIKNTILAGEAAYDAAYCPAYMNAPIGGMIAQGLFSDLNDIPDLQLDKPWWNQTINSECAIGNDKKLYFAWCDINIMNLQGPWCVYFNEDMMKNLNLDLPYNLVKSGEWTLDEFYKYAKTGAQLNGEDSFKWKSSSSAVYGYASFVSGTRALLCGTGEYLISKDSEGIPFLSIETSRFYDVCNKIADIIRADGLYIDSNERPSKYFEFLFRDERALMTIAELKAADTFREMDATFGIVPIPKYDKNQSRYYSSVTNAMPVLTVPNTMKDAKTTGVILDAMAYLSTRDIAPIFFDVTLSQKRLRNDESIEMLQIVKDSVQYGAGLAYGWSADLYVDICDDLNKGVSNAASQIEKHKDKIQINIDKTMGFID